MYYSIMRGLDLYNCNEFSTYYFRVTLPEESPMGVAFLVIAYIEVSIISHV